MDRVTILAINAVAYTVAAAYFYKRSGLSVGFVIWCVYMVSAWTSVPFVMQPDFFGSVHDEPISDLMGVGYLFVTLLLFIYPLTMIRKADPEKMSFNHPEALKVLMIGAIMLELLFVVCDLPVAIDILSAGADKLVDFRDEVYDEGNSSLTANPMLNRVALLFGCVPQICLGVSIYLMLCYDRDRSIVKLLFWVTIAQFAVSTVVQVSRGALVLTLIFCVVILVYMRDFLSARLKRILLVYCTPVVVIMIAFFWAISVSRFGDMANFMLFKYLGEPMVNFAGILYPDIDGFAGGRAYFQPVTYMITGIKDFVTEDKWDFIESVTSIPGYIFYTFVGGLIIDFGFIGTFIIAVLVNRCSMRLVRNDNCVSLGAIFCLFLLIYAYSSGVFFMTVQNFKGVFMILYTLILGYYFRNTDENRTIDISSGT